MKNTAGFSLLEISIVIFVMGITITALLQMFELGHLRYNAISAGQKLRSGLAEIRVWLRNRVAMAEIEQITVENLQKNVSLADGFRCTDLKISNYDSATYFIQLQLFEDRNRNGNPDPSETGEKKLFCFRRRNT
ncbi:MAG: prepilin-type N-terminal cleavage/methylation domain-containing protein [Candidatus Riflebacteria bacterium]